MKKTFIIDTSVLLYDKFSIHSFPDNDVIIPLVVLEELDRFKEKPGLLGESARYVNRFLDSLRGVGSLQAGVKLESGQTIRVERDRSKEVPSDLDEGMGDNKIIGIAIHLKDSSENPVVVITKDINFRVKCDALGIQSEDYYRDKIVDNSGEIYTGQAEISTSNSEIVDKLYEKKKVKLETLSQEMYPNQFAIVKSGKQSFLGIESEGSLTHLTFKPDMMVPVNPRNKEQKFALELLVRDDIPLVTLIGIAGSGKTFLTLLTALSKLKNKSFERIILTRSLQQVGKPIGFLPGDVKDKLEPWIGSIKDNFREHFKDITYFDLMRDKGEIEVVPLAFIRGRTFNNTFIIVDEAQNLTKHEIKTIITRVGEGSKAVFLGDIEQIDTPYIDSLSNGLTVIIEKLKNEKLAGHMTLMKGERSELATLASKLI